MTKERKKEEDVIEEDDTEKVIQEELADLSGEETKEEPSEKIINKEQEYLDGWKRCQADFENYKKRQMESQKDLLRYATEGMILQILPVIDNFSASTAHIPEDQKSNPWVTGIMYIQKQLEDVLKDNGIEEIDAKVGDNFDPAMHESIPDKECEGCKTKDYEYKNKIKQVVLKGYKIGDKIIRPARVIVE